MSVRYNQFKRLLSAVAHLAVLAVGALPGVAPRLAPRRLVRRQERLAGEEGQTVTFSVVKRFHSINWYMQ